MRRHGFGEGWAVLYSMPPPREEPHTCCPLCALSQSKLEDVHDSTHAHNAFCLKHAQQRRLEATAIAAATAVQAVSGPRRAWYKQGHSLTLPVRMQHPRPLIIARRYDGATEAAVLRCALVALGLPQSGTGTTAHLLWKSGEMVDFGKPITDGVTLHLNVAHAAPASHHDRSGGGGGFYSSGGGPGGAPSGFSGDGAGYGAEGGSAVAQRRVGGGGSSSTAAGGGSGAAAAAPGEGVDHRSDQRRRRRRRRRVEPSESSLAKRRALLTLRRFFGVGGGSGGGGGGFLNGFLEKTLSASDSEGEQERRPLLGLTRASSSTSLLSPSSSSTSMSGSGAVRGHGGGERGGDEVDGDGYNPDHQRKAILKLKRINAHLANERTMLAWVRCVGKMFTVAVLSLSLAGSAGDSTFSLCFSTMGMVYVAMGPYVVFVGASRCVGKQEGERRGGGSSPLPFFCCDRLLLLLREGFVFRGCLTARRGVFQHAVCARPRERLRSGVSCQEVDVLWSWEVVVFWRHVHEGSG